MFQRMLEIDRHLTEEVELWQREGMSAATIAIVLRSLAQRLDPVKQTWAQQWRASSGYRDAIAHLDKRRTQD